MPAAATSTQMLLNLTANVAQARGRGGNEAGSDFSATFQQQINARQNERLTQVEPTRPRAEQPQRETQVSRPDNGRPATENRPREAEPSESPDNIAPPGGEKSPSNSQETDTAAVDRTAPAERESETVDAAATAAATDSMAQQLSQANAALLLQLQNFVAVRPDVAAAASSQGEAAQSGSPVAQLANVLNALQQIHDQSQAANAPLDVAAKPLPRNELISFKTESLSEALQFAADRQALPADAEASVAPTIDFAELLQRRLPQAEQGAVARPEFALTGMTSRPGEPARQVEATRPQTSLYQPVGSEGWDRALGQKVVMMVDNNHQEVDMQLNPPNLGPLEVKLSLDRNEATLTFVAAHQPVREALQASLPRLNEMLAESGIQLGNVNIELGGRQTEQEREGGQRQGGRGNNGREDESLSTAPPVSRRLAMVGPGNVNLFV
ncbi:flagellar hook-length control protein FliK [Chitinimonas lacunae]|uniref:Flagellar hook-length control protein FliK n=1 Tax=Chitinimonas lacunae TaxID=1963018 RepID=A0ABV8MV98_9NEIS